MELTDISEIKSTINGHKCRLNPRKERERSNDLMNRSIKITQIEKGRRKNGQYGTW